MVSGTHVTLSTLTYDSFKRIIFCGSAQLFTSLVFKV